MQILPNIIFALLFVSAVIVMAKSELSAIRHYVLRCIKERRLILPKLSQVGLTSAFIAIALLLAFVTYQSLYAVNDTTVKGHDVGLFVHVMRYAFFGAMGILFAKAVWESVLAKFRGSK